jgi:hypothetical protein
MPENEAKKLAARIQREKTTVTQMTMLYCRAHHHTQGGLCPECAQLAAYAAERIERCRFQPNKPVCSRCPVHCYQASQREKIRQVMRFAGPRMLWHHPGLALAHLVHQLSPLDPRVLQAAQQAASRTQQ